MGRRERAGSKNSRHGQVWKRNVKSDDSDEDYRLEEDELDDQTDELESLAGDASDEEDLGSFADEEDEDEIVKKVVRSNSRKRFMGQIKKEINKSSKRRKRTLYDEDEEEDDDGFDNDCDSDDDEFKPDSLDYLDEEEELTSLKGKNKKKGDTDDDEFNPDDLDISDEEEVPCSKGRKKKKGDSDEDEFYPDDQDYLDEEDELPSSNGKNKKKGDKDDDEFNPNDQDFSDEEKLPFSKGKNKRKGDTDDDDDFNPDDQDYLDEEEEEEEEEHPSSKLKNKKKGDTDDDEFNPDDLDLLDEEEFTSSKGRNRKKGQYSLKKIGSMRGQKKKTGGNLLKKPPKKRRKVSSRSTKSITGKSRKSKSRLPTSRAISKRTPTRRKKKATPSSDSDFVSSESTDREFTISEEEREQVREATEFCRREPSNLRSSKRDQEDAAPRNLPRRKGKEKVVQEVKYDDVAKQFCGICLTEEGKNTIRGTLNCCNHFFCFACIIEWSKVESRCPLCKQRFMTISKTARSATKVDLRDAVIQVPERDQVYQPSEEELRDYLDPYENVICTECHEGGDDALMLLCDLCDSPAHTYCVGLGRDVPDGNWYCEGCRPSALGISSSPTQRPNNIALNEPCTFENMAEVDLNITIPETPTTPGNGFLVSPRQQQPQLSGLGGFQPQPPPPVSGVGVSTLSGRRRVRRLQYHMSSNRLGQMGFMRVDPATSERWPHFSGSWGDQPAQSPGTMDVGTLYRAEYMHRLQESSFGGGTPTSRESFSGRQNIVRGGGQVLQVSSAADGTSYGCMQLGQVGGISLGLNSVPTAGGTEGGTKRETAQGSLL